MGQPVTKVVNPLGTVITVSADEEDINSSQEFDSAEESHVPEPPRSVCAEEGPASLGDLEPESQTLRDLTEICAEMRSASEPAIDSVPDENICEVKERKALCVEIAPITNPGNSTIDFEKEEAFRDVPTSLSLCVEQGEIPSSPMTQAKEAVWCKKYDKREDRGAHERNVSEAQYVVNCDEESVVLMENKVIHGRKSASTHCKTESKKTCESEKVTKKSGKNGSAATSSKRVETKTSAKKYVLKEHEDSIVIEDATCEDTKSNCSKKKKEKSVVEDTKSEYSDSGESSKESAIGKSKTKSKSSTVPDIKETKLESDMECKSSAKQVEPIIELDAIIEEADKKEDFKSTVNIDVLIKEIDKYKSPPSDSTDDFSSSEYHIVDTPCCNKDGTSVQSDEDIEHIQSCEITQLQQAECTDSNKCLDVISCSVSSPIMQRKNSKNTISDDDIEYIHSSELADTPDKLCKEDSKFETDKSSDSESATTRGKRTFSDDDLEHVHHSDVCAVSSEVSKDVYEKSTKKSQEIPPEQVSKSKGTKKTKDIVVIESDTSAADVTVIFKPAESWKNKSTEKKEEPEEGVNTLASETSSPLRKAKVRPVKTSPSNVAPKRSQAGIEIIDIDAMQKAEMEVLIDTTAVSECKILSGPEVCGTRAKKSRKNKKSSNESNVQTSEATIELAKPVEEAVKDSKPQESVSEFSWSAVVKKKSGSPVADSETRKEDDKVEDKVKQPCDSIEVSSCSPILEKIESLKKKIHESSLRKNLDKKSSGSQVAEKLREAVLELDPEESSLQTSEISWSSVVRKKSASSVEREIKKDPESDPVQEEASEEKKSHRRHGESSARFSTIVDQLKEAVTDHIVKDSSVQTSEGSWSFVVKKKIASSTEPITRKEPVEQKPCRRVDLLTDSLEITSGHETKSVASHSSANTTVESSTNDCVLLKFLSSSADQPSSLKVTEKTSKLETLSEVVEKDSSEPKNWNVGTVLVDPAFSKEDSSEPEQDTEPEKRSDSEQDIVPERSSSSDELNANVVFTNTEAEYSGRETSERTATNGLTSSVCATSKKGNRSKKKKRR